MQNYTFRPQPGQDLFDSIEAFIRDRADIVNAGVGMQEDSFWHMFPGYIVDLHIRREDLRLPSGGAIALQPLILWLRSSMRCTNNSMKSSPRTFMATLVFAGFFITP